MNRRLSNIILGFIVLTNNFILSQDKPYDNHSVTIVVPKVAMLDIESTASKNIALTLSAPSEAGEIAQKSIDDDRIWLNVTSVVENGQTRDISVKVDEPVPGVDIKVVSDSFSGAGFGSWGTPQEEVTLSSFDQILVSGIKSGESGEGVNNGFNLKYIAMGNYTKFGDITSSTGKESTVIYTLTR